MVACRPLHIVHVIEQLTLGGPLNAIAGAAKHVSAPARARHRIVSLLRSQRRAREVAAENGIPVLSSPDAGTLNALLAGADLVQLHFWNSPEIHEFMASSLPDMRVLIWCHVNGQAPPHILPRALFEFGDIVVATAPSSLQLPFFRAADRERVALIPGGADFARLEGLQARPHAGFQVGYIGRLDFCKLHASFVPMSAAIEVPEVRFLVCGDGRDRSVLERQAKALGVADRFSFRGYVENIADILAQTDVFGYPLGEGNHATGELAIQEAMYAGVPPVIFPYGGAADVVAHRHNGIIVQSESEYSAAIAWLHKTPADRKRLGENAARDARTRLGAQKSGPALEALYERMMGQPKRSRTHIPMPADPMSEGAERVGAWLLVHSLDGIGDADFVASLTPETESEALVAEERISQAPPGMADVVLQYRFRHPNDPHLRLWSGLVLRKRRNEIATAEFKASLALGCDYPRVQRYFYEGLRLSSGNIED